LALPPHSRNPGAAHGDMSLYIKNW